MIIAIIFTILIIGFGIMIFKIIDLEQEINTRSDIIQKLEDKLKTPIPIPLPEIRIERPDIIDLESKFEIHFEDIDRINENKIKHILGNGFIDEIKNNMEIISEDDYRRRTRIYRARIRILEVKK